MEFQPIQPKQLNLEMQNSPIIQTNTVRMVQGQSLLDKPTFGQKFMLGLKKAGSLIGRIGGSLLRFFPLPGSQIAAAGLYGLGEIAEQSHQNQVQKRLDELSLDENAARTNFNFFTPGLNSGSNVAASSSSLQQERLNTVLNREAAARESISVL
jgi:hypothetical protein